MSSRPRGMVRRSASPGRLHSTIQKRPAHSDLSSPAPAHISSSIHPQMDIRRPNSPPGRFEDGSRNPRVSPRRRSRSPLRRRRSASPAKRRPSPPKRAPREESRLTKRPRSSPPNRAKSPPRRTSRDRLPPPRETREAREAREARGSRDGRDTRSVRTIRDARDGRDGREARDGRDARDARDARDGRDGRDARNARDTRDGRDRDRERGERGERGERELVINTSTRNSLSARFDDDRPVFNGPEGIPFDRSQLKNITININRNKINPEEITLKRRPVPVRRPGDYHQLNELRKMEEMRMAQSRKMDNPMPSRPWHLQQMRGDASIPRRFGEGSRPLFDRLDVSVNRVLDDESNRRVMTARHSPVIERRPPESRARSGEGRPREGYDRERERERGERDRGERGERGHRSPGRDYETRGVDVRDRYRDERGREEARHRGRSYERLRDAVDDREEHRRRRPPSPGPLPRGRMMDHHPLERLRAGRELALAAAAAERGYLEVNMLRERDRFELVDRGYRRW